MAKSSFLNPPNPVKIGIIAFLMIILLVAADRCGGSDHTSQPAKPTSTPATMPATQHANK